MEREPQGGSDYGLDLRRDMGDEPPSSMRDSAPDLLAPIDAEAPVSGHNPPPDSPRTSIAEAPEHDWSAASGLIYPALRPPGIHGLTVSEIDEEALA